MSHLVDGLPVIGSEWVLVSSPWVLGKVLGLEAPLSTWSYYQVNLNRIVPNLDPELFCLALPDFLKEWEPKGVRSTVTRWQYLKRDPIL